MKQIYTNRVYNPKRMVVSHKYTMSKQTVKMQYKDKEFFFVFFCVLYIIDKNILKNFVTEMPRKKKCYHLSQRSNKYHY